MKKKPKLLAVRNDRLGDLILAWPALQTLHINLPEARLFLLANAYTAPLAAVCRGVDTVLCDPARSNPWVNASAIAHMLRPETFDASVSFFSRFDTALALMLARIPLRAAPATKTAQIFHTHRLRQRRSFSVKPEYVYNLELADYFLRLLGVAEPIRAKPPYLVFAATELRDRRRTLRIRYGLPEAQPWAFIHPGHGGSAVAPSAPLLGRIARALQAAGAAIVITSGPLDGEAVAALERELDGVPHAIYHSDQGLVSFARTLACADVFIAGSTGPLHIAGALNRPTVAFYPRRRSASVIRWQTLNEESRRLAYTPPPGAGENDYSAIDAERVAETVTSLLKPHHS